MKTALVVIGILFLGGCSVSDELAIDRCGSAGFPQKDAESRAEPADKSYWRMDFYGPGMHADQYGLPVILWVDGEEREYSEIIPAGRRLRIKKDFYGLGTHSDQYGRPVREYPWP